MDINEKTKRRRRRKGRKGKTKKRANEQQRKKKTRKNPATPKHSKNMPTAAAVHPKLSLQHCNYHYQALSPADPTF